MAILMEGNGSTGNGSGEAEEVATRLKGNGEDCGGASGNGASLLCGATAVVSAAFDMIADDMAWRCCVCSSASLVVVEARLG